MVRGTARGWIALGDNAHGVVFALGGVATGTIALGVVSVGVFSVGVLSFGGLACAWVAVGWIADGAFAFGDMAFGTFAGFGIEAATGMIAVAKHIAEGMFSERQPGRSAFDVGRSMLDVGRSPCGSAAPGRPAVSNLSA